MWRTSLFLPLLFSILFASPITTLEPHERRELTPHGWDVYSKAPGSMTLHMKIALRQSNTSNLYQQLKHVSDPASACYGKHWTAKEVSKAFAPEKGVANSVAEWLIASGIDERSIEFSTRSGWLMFNATVSEVERILHADYFVYRHTSARTHVACTKYHLPPEIQENVDFIMPTIHFDVPVAQRSPMKRRNPAGEQRKQLGRHQARNSRQRNTVPHQSRDVLGVSYLNQGPSKRSTELATSLSSDLDNCVHQITPSCVRALYQMPINASNTPGNSFAIIEYTPQSYMAADLDNFFRVFSPEQVGQRPNLNSIDGGVLPNSTEAFAYNSESDLDLQYAMALVYPQNVTLYLVGDTIEGASFNNFLDAIDSTYCTYEGGDDPEHDSPYPDPNPKGFQGPEACGAFTSTNVLSTSYGYSELELSAAYMIRQCNEYAKLGLMGITVLYSSMDFGVAGNDNQCIDPTTEKLNNGTYGLFNPAFPSSCPYVTSVGATQIGSGGTVNSPEQACETVTFSGGGFSNYFGVPEYQQKAQQTYFAEYAPSYGAERFNNSQVSRGYPDLSANGANYLVNIDGVFQLVYGTSAATPVVGAIITQINAARLTAGKQPVGFINPALYAHPETMTDITLGQNPGCGTAGFNATTGWDPVTGLGTPKFPKMLEMFMSLP